MPADGATALLSILTKHVDVFVNCDGTSARVSRVTVCCRTAPNRTLSHSSSCWPHESRWRHGLLTASYDPPTAALPGPAEPSRSRRRSPASTG